MRFPSGGPGPQFSSGKGKTDVNFVYTISIPREDGRWVPSGYSVSGHVIIEGGTNSNEQNSSELQCSVDKTDQNAPARHFDCLTSTFSRPTDRNPEPRWEVTAGTIPSGIPAPTSLATPSLTGSATAEWVTPAVSTTRSTIQNWAMIGSTAADWDPVTNGQFGGKLKKIKDAYVTARRRSNPCGRAQVCSEELFYS